MDQNSQFNRTLTRSEYSALSFEIRILYAIFFLFISKFIDSAGKPMWTICVKYFKGQICP